MNRAGSNDRPRRSGEGGVFDPNGLVGGRGRHKGGGKAAGGAAGFDAQLAALNIKPIEGQDGFVIQEGRGGGAVAGFHDEQAAVHTEEVSDIKAVAVFRGGAGFDGDGGVIGEAEIAVFDPDGAVAVAGFKVVAGLDRKGGGFYGQVAGAVDGFDRGFPRADLDGKAAGPVDHEVLFGLDGGQRKAGVFGGFGDGIFADEAQGDSFLLDEENLIPTGCGAGDGNGIHREHAGVGIVGNGAGIPGAGEDVLAVFAGNGGAEHRDTVAFLGQGGAGQERQAKREAGKGGQDAGCARRPEEFFQTKHEKNSFL